MRTLILKLLIISAFLLSAMIFASCSDSGEVKDEPGSTTDDSEYIYIVKDGVSDFYIIRSDYGNKESVDIAVGFRRAVSNATGADMGISTDWEKNPTYEHEIIIGETLREKNGVQIDRIMLGETGYIIKEADGKIYIAGGSDKGTALASDYFIRTFVKSGGEIKIPVGYELIVYHQYDISELYIGMNRVDTGYKIIIPENSDKAVKDAAERLKQAIYEKTGLMLSVENGTASAKNAFVISDEVPEISGVYEMRVNGTSFVFSSSAKTGIAGCVDRFINLYIADKFGKYNFPSDFRYLDLGDYFIITYPDK